MSLHAALGHRGQDDRAGSLHGCFDHGIERIQAGGLVHQIEQHRVASEFFQIRADAAEIINESRAQGGRVIAVGTTTTRALESAVNAAGRIEPGEKETELTITPGYHFRVTDALLTNFHLPRSSLLLLVSAFAGRDFTLDAYRYAAAERFRFYSYGDCMFVI